MGHRVSCPPNDRHVNALQFARLSRPLHPEAFGFASELHAAAKATTTSTTPPSSAAAAASKTDISSSATSAHLLRQTTPASHTDIHTRIEPARDCSCIVWNWAADLVSPLSRPLLRALPCQRTGPKSFVPGPSHWNLIPGHRTGPYFLFRRPSVALLPFRISHSRHCRRVCDRRSSRLETSLTSI